MMNSNSCSTVQCSLHYSSRLAVTTYLMKDVWVSRSKYRRSFRFYVDNNFRPNSVDDKVITGYYAVTVNTMASSTPHYADC